MSRASLSPRARLAVLYGRALTFPAPPTAIRAVPAGALAGGFQRFLQRAHAQRAAITLLRALAAAAAVTCLALLARDAGAAEPLPLALLGVAGLVVIAGVCAIPAQRPHAVEIAHALDRSLGLHEQLGSALEVDPAAGPLALLLHGAARRTLRALDPARVLPWPSVRREVAALVSLSALVVVLAVRAAPVPAQGLATALLSLPAPSQHSRGPRPAAARPAAPIPRPRRAPGPASARAAQPQAGARGGAGPARGTLHFVVLGGQPTAALAARGPQQSGATGTPGRRAGSPPRGGAPPARGQGGQAAPSARPPGSAGGRGTPRSQGGGAQPASQGQAAGQAGARGQGASGNVQTGNGQASAQVPGAQQGQPSASASGPPQATGQSQTAESRAGRQAAARSASGPQAPGQNAMQGGPQGAPIAGPAGGAGRGTGHAAGRTPGSSGGATLSLGQSVALPGPSGPGSQAILTMDGPGTLVASGASAAPDGDLHGLPTKPSYVAPDGNAVSSADRDIVRTYFSPSSGESGHGS